MTKVLQHDKLAINGGAPVRNKPFQSSCYISGDEKQMILDCLDSNNWSSFKAGTEGWDIREVGKMTSREAVKHGPTAIRYLGGKYVRELEHDFADYVGVDYAVSSNSATSCLVMALGAMNIEPGDEVLVPSMSFNATATAVLFYNAIPIFTEVKSDTFCMDPDDVRSKITDRTRAILVVHLGGTTADMDAIMQIAREYNLKVIEDCAQAPGVKYKGKQVGSIGDMGVLSLTETKNINCGEGGMLTTNNPQYAFKSRLIRNHGEGVVQEDWPVEDMMNIVGMNFRMTELQAAVAIPQLKSLESRNQSRVDNTKYITDALSKYPELIQPVAEEGADYVCFMLKWRYIPSTGMPSRQELVKALNAEGIPVGAGYGRLMYENPIFTKRMAYGRKGYPFTESRNIKYGKGTCPKSEEINGQFIWFKFVNAPNTIEDMQDVVAAFEKILG